MARPSKKTTDQKLGIVLSCCEATRSDETDSNAASLRRLMICRRDTRGIPTLNRILDASVKQCALSAQSDHGGHGASVGSRHSSLVGGKVVMIAVEWHRAQVIVRAHSAPVGRRAVRGRVCRHDG